MLHDLTMSSIVFPESVSGLTISSRTESSLSLDWTYQSGGYSPRTGVEIEVRKSGVLVRNTTEEAADLGAITISSLLPLTSYSITMYVVRDVGRSQPSTTINTNTLSLSESMDELVIMTSISIHILMFMSGLPTPKIITFIAQSSSELFLTWQVYTRYYLLYMCPIIS